jgi:hypothetical protein
MIMIIAVVGTAAGVAVIAPAGAAADPAHHHTASVKIFDRYHFGKVKVVINGTRHKVAPGDVTPLFPVTPAPTGNDIVQISSLRAPGCGYGTASRYFAARESYRLVVFALPHDQKCRAHGATVDAVSFKVKRII